MGRPKAATEHAPHNSLWIALAALACAHCGDDSADGGGGQGAVPSGSAGGGIVKDDPVNGDGFGVGLSVINTADVIDTPYVEDVIVTVHFTVAC